MPSPHQLPVTLPPRRARRPSSRITQGMVAVIALGCAVSGCGAAHNPFGAAPTATVTITPTAAPTPTATPTPIATLTPTADPVITPTAARPTVPSSSQQVDASNLARDMLDISPPRGYQWNAENTATLRIDIDQMIALFDGTTRANEAASLQSLFGAALDERKAGSDSRRWWVTLAGLITNGDQARSFEDPLPGYLDPNDHGAGGTEPTTSPTTADTAASTDPTAEPTATTDPGISVPPSTPPTSVPVGTDDPGDFEEIFIDDLTYQVPVELAPGLFEFSPADSTGVSCRVYVYNAHRMGRGYKITHTERLRVRSTDTEVATTGCEFSRIAR